MKLLVTMTTTLEPGGCLVTMVILVLIHGRTCTEQGHEVLPNRTESACFSSTSGTKVLSAHCPSRHMVYIVDLFYGHSATGACHHKPSDCTLSDFMSPSCVGRQTCEINLPSGTLGRQIPHCRLHSNYMQLVYRCIPDIEVYDVCTAGTVRTQAGYLRTPAYPNNYPNSRKCTATVTVHPTQRLRLHVVELDLESGPDGCSDLLYVQGAFRSSSLCGQRSHDQVFTTVGNSLNLTFTSDAAGRNKGFWLYYEAFPYLEPTTAGPSTTTEDVDTRPLTSSLPPPGVGLGTNTVLPPGRSTPHSQGITPGVAQQQQGRLPLEAIVGGLLGSLLCILLVLLILLIIKRRKEREAIPSSTSTCFLHNKQGTVGRSGAPYIQNNLAMVDDSPMC